jgi:DNA-binding transcriptional ArsR family regulator
MLVGKRQVRTLPRSLAMQVRYRGVVEAERTATLFATLGHPVRVNVLRILIDSASDGRNAGDLATLLSVPPATLSFHLAELKRSGFVTTRKQGKFNLYRADRAALREVLIIVGEVYLGIAPAFRQ